MKEKGKIFITCTLAMSIIFSSNSFAEMKLYYDGKEHNYTADPITLIIDEQEVETRVPPIIMDSKTLVPAREVLERLGANLSWIDESKELIISYNNNIVLLKIDNITANVNGEPKQMDIAPKIINDLVMIPLRFVAESFDCEIGWNGNERKAFINTKSSQLEENSETESSTQLEENSETESSTQLEESGEAESSTQLEESGEAESSTQLEESGEAESSTQLEESGEAESSTQLEESGEAESSTQLEESGEAESSTQLEESGEAESSTQLEQSTETESSTQAEQSSEAESISNSEVKVEQNIITIMGETVENEVETYKPITNEDYEVTNLIGIDMPENGNEIFKIKASSKISSISYDLIQDPTRLYIDITNSISNLNENIEVTGSNIVSSIRTSQQPKLDNVTRIVFDLDGSQSYDIFFSDDRQTLNVKFKSSTINKLTFEKSDNEDTLNIYSNSTLIPNIMRLSDSDRLVIDIPNTYINISGTQPIESKYISDMRISQFEKSTVRIVLDVKSLFDYEIIDNNTYLTIKLKQPTYKNIEYHNSNDSPKLILKKLDNIDINSIIHQDNYLDNNYKLTLKGDYSNLYGYGNFKINDGYLNFIDIRVNDGNTEFIFNEKNVYTCKITEDEANIYLNILNPKSVYKHVIVIDPGHGGSAPGAIYNGLTEKNVTLDVGTRLYKLLENDPDIKVYATRLTDSNPSFNYRVDLPNHAADMFVSVHCNSISSSSVSGVQVFYPDPSDERGQKSQALASFLMEGVTSNTGFPNRPANQALGYQFYVLKYTNVPACLVEMGFLTNRSDAEKLSTEEGRQEVAQGVYEGIKKGFETLNLERK